MNQILAKHNANGFICDKKIEQIAKMYHYNNTKDLNRMSLASKKISIRHELENSSYLEKNLPKFMTIKLKFDGFYDDFNMKIILSLISY